MNLIRKMTAMLLALCMLLGVPAVAEDDLGDDVFDVPFGEEITVEADAEDAEADEDDEEGDVYIPDESEEDLTAMAEILDAEIDDSIDPESLELNKNLPDNVVNILLIGVDSRSSDITNSNQHGDVQIIVSINKDTGSLKLTSVLRDLYVTIPGYKSKNRINVANARGGGKLAMRTINHNFELNIEHYVTINFYGLASIIDSLGGIDIDLTAKEASAINTYIRKHPPKYDNQDKDYERVPLEKKKGVQHLDGIQAVMYARLRTIDNDFVRTARQRHLLELLMAKVLDGGMDIDKLLKLLETCIPYAKTNMSTRELVNLALAVLRSGILGRLENGESLLEQNRIPMDDTWKYHTTDAGASVVAFRTTARHKENVQKLHEFIYGEYIPAD